MHAVSARERLEPRRSDGGDIPVAEDAGSRVMDSGLDARVVVQVCLSIIRPPPIQFDIRSMDPKTTVAGVDELLDLVVKVMNERPELVVEIQGHADKGEGRGLMVLSEKRARAVQQLLTQRGIGRERLCVRGYADERPVADPSSAEGRMRNRRVEFRVVDADEPCVR